MVVITRDTNRELFGIDAMRIIKAQTNTRKCFIDECKLNYAVRK